MSQTDQIKDIAPNVRNDVSVTIYAFGIIFLPGILTEISTVFNSYYNEYIKYRLHVQLNLHLIDWIEQKIFPEITFCTRNHL